MLFFFSISFCIYQLLKCFPFLTFNPATLSGSSGNQNANNTQSGESIFDIASTSGTPVVPKQEEPIIDSDSKASIDLNRSVHLMQDTVSSMNRADLLQSLRDMEVPSFDLNFEVTPEKEKSNNGMSENIVLSYLQNYLQIYGCSS